MEKKPIFPILNRVKWTGVLIFLFLPLLSSGCTTDTETDEDFEMPTTNFPLLGNVPNPPDVGSFTEVAAQQERLESEREEAIHQQKKIIKSIRGHNLPP